MSNNIGLGLVGYRSILALQVFLLILTTGCAMTYNVRPAKLIALNDDNSVYYVQEDKDNILFSAETVYTENILKYYMKYMKDSIKNNTILTITKIDMWERYIGAYEYDKVRGELRLVFTTPYGNGGVPHHIDVSDVQINNLGVKELTKPGNPGNYKTDVFNIDEARRREAEENKAK